MYRATDKQQAQMNMKEFWDKRLGRSVLTIARGDSSDSADSKKLLTHNLAAKLEKNQKTNSSPNKGGAKMSTKMKNNSRNVPSASETSMTFDPSSCDEGGVSKHSRKIRGKGRGNAVTKTNYTDKNDWGYSEGLAVANTKFMGGRK